MESPNYDLSKSTNLLKNRNMTDTAPTATEKATEKATANKPSGYRQKPKWIYLTAAILMLSPLGNMIFTLANLNIKGWYKPTVWVYWAQFVQPSTWFILGLLFASGLMLLTVRKWTFNLCLAILAVIIVYDIMMIRQFQILGIGAIVIMLAFTLAFAFLLYFTEFRRPYINPRLRWWETSPRYKVDLPVSIDKSSKPGILVDISRTGLLVEWTNENDIPDIEGETQITLPTQTAIDVQIKRRTAKGYGLEFGNLNRSQKKDLQLFIETLSIDPTKLQR